MKNRPSQTSATSNDLLDAAPPRATAEFRCICRARLAAKPGRIGLLVAAIALSPAANAVIVRGTVTDPLGAVVIGARVRLVQGTQVVAFGRTETDGSFEIRSTAKGRFRLLTSAATFTPAVGTDFYGGVTDVVSENVVVEPSAITESVTVTATGIPTPVQQASSAVSFVTSQELATHIGVSDALRQAPGLEVVQQGQTGGVTSLFVRGGNSTANKVLIDGIAAEDVGGTFDFGTVAQTAISSIETYRGPNSVLYGSDAGASVVALSTPRGDVIYPLLVYTADGGNFNTFRNQGEFSGTRQRLDYYGAFGRFDTSNALPLDRYHSATSAANLGYALTSAIEARFTIRNAVSSTGLPGAHDFFGISDDGKQSDQDLYSGLTIESRSLGDRWHNLARYGITRKREQERQYAYPGTAIFFAGSGGFPGYTLYFGDTVTIHGANGYSATGQTSFFGANADSSSNRDELYFQSDFAFHRRFTGLFGFRYENERGSFVDSDFGQNERGQRTNFEYTLQFQGDVKGRLFYSAGGAVEKNHLYGIAGTPRIGVAYVPVRLAKRRFRGTKLRASAATGVQEPTLALQFASLYTQLLQAGDTVDIARYNIGQGTAQRSRSYDAGIDQNILGERLIFKAGYFHNQFDHQLESVDANGLHRYFGLPISVAQQVPNGAAFLNSLAYRAQGAEAEIQWQALPHLSIHGGYTYLDSVVTQSFATDAAAAANGAPTTNPNLPGVAIGAFSPLVGARPFRRAPHTGFFAVEYTQRHVGAGIEGALSGRSDDSTFLGFADLNGGNTLLLPNRDLDFGYAKLDAHLSLVATRHITIYTQLDNLLSQQHIGPIGYPALPFQVRGGVKIRFGGG